MAVLGGCLFTLKKPGPAKKPAVEMTAAQAVSASSTESTGGGDRDLQSD
jgi:hypothetical protein